MLRTNVIQKLRCAPLESINDFQPLMEFQPKIWIHFLINVFLCVAVLTAKGPDRRTNRNFSSIVSLTELVLFYNSSETT